MSTIAPTVHQLPTAPPGPLRRSVLAVAIIVALGLLASILTGTASAATVKRHVDPQPGSVLDHPRRRVVAVRRRRPAVRHWAA